ncbi:unnamed protein product, partial [Prunus brigantina]
IVQQYKKCLTRSSNLASPKLGSQNSELAKRNTRVRANASLSRFLQHRLCSSSKLYSGFFFFLSPFTYLPSLCLQNLVALHSHSLPIPFRF